MKYKNLSLIVAVSKNNVIGINNGLPWNIKEDLNIFKEKTMGKDIIMGRNTYLSLPKKLKNRTYHVLTTNKLDNDNLFVYNNLEDMLNTIENSPHKDFVVIGGEVIYKIFLDYIERAYISYIDLNVENGDAFFNFININEFEVKEEIKFSNFTFKEYKIKK